MLCINCAKAHSLFAKMKAIKLILILILILVSDLGCSRHVDARFQEVAEVFSELAGGAG